jgi:transposase-like protein
MKDIKLFYCNNCKQETMHKLEGIQKWAHMIPGKANQEVWSCEKCGSTFYKELSDG